MRLRMDRRLQIQDGADVDREALLERPEVAVCAPCWGILGLSVPAVDVTVVEPDAPWDLGLPLAPEGKVRGFAIGLCERCAGWADLSARVVSAMLRAAQAAHEPRERPSGRRGRA